MRFAIQALKNNLLVLFFYSCPEMRCRFRGTRPVGVSLPRAVLARSDRQVRGYCHGRLGKVLSSFIQKLWRGLKPQLQINQNHLHASHLFNFFRDYSDAFFGLSFKRNILEFSFLGEFLLIICDSSSNSIRRVFEPRKGRKGWQ